MNYKTALFDHTSTNDPRGVLVTVPGSNADGRSFIRWKSLRKFAKRNNLALVGSFFEDIEPKNIEGYADASGGSGQALLDYLEKYGLGKLPIYLWGFSAGGQFNYEMACWRPDRIAAFVVNKGGFYYHALAPIATRKVPGIFFVGDHDDLFRQYIVIGIYLMNKRDHECVWKLVQEKDSAHDPGESLELSLDFFEEILQDREVS